VLRKTKATLWTDALRTTSSGRSGDRLVLDRFAALRSRDASAGGDWRDSWFAQAARALNARNVSDLKVCDFPTQLPPQFRLTMPPHCHT
jgi:hypothetical protein